MTSDEGGRAGAARAFRRGAIADGAVWLVLVALVLGALTASETLGTAGFLIAVVAAIIEALVLAILFMRLREAGALVRLAGGIGFALLTAMFALSLADLLTRR